MPRAASTRASTSVWFEGVSNLKVRRVLMVSATLCSSARSTPSKGCRVCCRVRGREAIVEKTFLEKPVVSSFGKRVKEYDVHAMLKAEPRGTVQFSWDLIITRQGKV